jgi:hypothetical protein
MFNPTFSLYFWVRITTGGVIYSINRPFSVTPSQEDIFSLSTQDSNVSVKFSSLDGVLLDYTTPDAAVKLDDWLVLLLTVTWTGTETSVEVFVDNASKGTATFGEAFFDSDTYLHFLGAEYSTSSGGTRSLVGWFHGYLYKLCYNPVALTDIPVRASPCPDGDFCSICPEQADCLYDCNWD